jgi:hypothetical protein
LKSAVGVGGGTLGGAKRDTGDDGGSFACLNFGIDGDGGCFQDVEKALRHGRKLFCRCEKLATATAAALFDVRKGGAGHDGGTFADVKNGTGGNRISFFQNQNP